MYKRTNDLLTNVINITKRYFDVRTVTPDNRKLQSAYIKYVIVKVIERLKEDEFILTNVEFPTQMEVENKINKGKHGLYNYYDTKYVVPYGKNDVVDIESIVKKVKRKCTRLFYSDDVVHYIESNKLTLNKVIRSYIEYYQMSDDEMDSLADYIKGFIIGLKKEG